ncbi:MAG: NUDIX hydrolase [Planctomycetaceae bacterium]|nr:NUDIX hydrolase [Planctomycetaceae bacterium]
MPRKRVETVAQGVHLALRRRDHWEFADRIRGSGVVAIVAVTQTRELILTEQYRPPVQKKVIDLPAGLSGDIAGAEQEPLLRAAKRELLEETGFTSRNWTMSFCGPSSAGMSTEMIQFFLARDCQRKTDGGGDESESIKVHVVPLDRIQRWLQRKSTSRTCIDPKVYAALGLLNGAAQDH